MTNLELAQKRKENVLKTINREKHGWVPMMASASGATLSYAGVTYWDVENDPEKFRYSLGKVFEEMPTDAVFSVGIIVTARANEILRGLCQTSLGRDGVTIQHLQKSFMKEDEYAECTKDPMGFIKNVLLKRMYPFIFEEGFENAKKTVKDFLVEQAKCGPLSPSVSMPEYLLNTYGIPSLGYSTFVTTPGDYIFDHFRGFKGTLMDLRRHYKEMVDLCESLWENGFSQTYYGQKLPADKFPAYMAHIPTYLNPKQYDELCFKYFKKQVESIVEAGSKLHMASEGGWKHIFPMFRDLPKDSVIISLEDDDPCEVYDVIGDCQVLKGGGRLAQMKLGSLESNTDFAKKCIDHCAPGNAFIFGVDKPWVCAGDITKTMIDTFKFVEKYGVYE